MSKVDWSKAPEGAEACIDGAFTKWVGTVEYCFYEGHWYPEHYGSYPLSKYFERNEASGYTFWSIEINPAYEHLVATAKEQFGYVTS